MHQLGSKVKVNLPFRKKHEHADGSFTITALDISGFASRRVVILKPNGLGGFTEVTPAPELTIVNAATGIAYWEGTLGDIAEYPDGVGTWKFQGFADEYFSEPVSIVVKRNLVAAVPVP
jgi:hypothetical protein